MSNTEQYVILLILICLGVGLFLYVIIFLIRNFIKLIKEEKNLKINNHE
jgi:hypothetical protein